MKQIFVLLAALAMGFAVSAGEPSATDLKMASGFSLSIQLARAAQALTLKCGPSISKLIFSAIKDKKSAAEMQETLSRFNGSAECKRAFHTYNLVTSEVYLRVHEATIRAQLKIAKLPQYKDLQERIRNAEKQAEVTKYLQVVDANGARVLIGGPKPLHSRGMIVTVLKVGQPESETKQVPVGLTAGTEWSQAIYLRRGKGEYVIRLLTPTEETASTHYYLYSGALRVQLETEIDPDLSPSEQAQSDHATIIELANSLTRGADSERAKAQAIHDWIIKNITYDYPTLENMAKGATISQITEFNGGPHSSLLTLKKRSGICVDYAALYAALLRAAGVKVKIIYGNTPRGEHAWNEVSANGKWMNVDTTWDAAAWDQKYFDTEPSVFAQEHASGYDSGF